MKESTRFFWLSLGLILGIAATSGFQQPARPALAANDRFEDYVLTTGPIRLGLNIEADGIWLLDYRAGKLLGTIVDRTQGKVNAWATVDLVQEFGIPPKQNVHFLMTTGAPIKGQSALYLTEINSGKFGVYTMAPTMDGKSGMMIRRHSATTFRPPQPQP